jgi:DNA-binding NarL/FixJ family response regulator
VLQLIAEGSSTKDIAAQLGISAKTVESHRSKLMRKLDIHDTAGLVRYAIRSGVTQA